MRVIPRDLFNESNLLKCYGALWIALDGNDKCTMIHDGEAFDIVEDANGCLSIANIRFTIGHDEYELFRPLNSREAWPLYCVRDDIECEVFNNDGTLSAEFMELI